jgi:PAS domain S-box-containing protein
MPRSQAMQRLSSTMRIDIAPDPTRGDAGAGGAPNAPVKGVRAQCPLVGSADFRELLANVYDAALITDPTGRIHSANERAVRFFGHDLDALCLLNVVDIVSGADALLLPSICEHLENERFVLIQAYCIRANDAVFPAEISVNRLRLLDSAYLSFFIRDTTLRKEAEDRLRTGAAAIHNSGSAIAIADVHGCLQYCNPALPRLLGMTDAAALPGTDIWTFLSDASPGAGIMASLAEAAAWAGELELRRGDGSTVAVQASAAPNVNADGEVTGMVLSFLDISDQKRALAALRERNLQIEEDLQLAREFQQAFMRMRYPVFPDPSTPPEESAVRFAAAYRSSGAVGGDFYDILPLSKTRVGIFISDVMGHGVRSALVVATVRGIIKELICLGDDPGTFLTAVNRDLHALATQGGQVAFVTAAYAVLDLTTGAVQYGLAGHPAPFWLQRTSGTLARLASTAATHGPALGLFSDAVYSDQTLTIAPGDTLLLYTDGLAEAEDEDEVPYEAARMRACIEAHAAGAPQQLVDALLADVAAFTGQRRLVDDVCIVAAELAHLLPT